MNSRVSVEAEDQVSGEEDTSDPPQDPSPASPQPESQGNVVLVLPPKETSDDCIPIMLNGVPVYISHTDSGSPLYIRQYPPTLEDIMLRRPEDLLVNFDGFSDASGQTFEGFSEGSTSSVLFEGFSEDGVEMPTFSVFQNSASSFTDEDDMSSAESKPHRKKSEGSRKARARSKDLGERGKQSRSSSSSRKRIKQEKGDKPPGNKTPHSSQASNRRRQSTDKREKDSLDCIGLEMSKKPRHLPSPGNPDYIGEQCNDIGCTVSFLERMAIREVQITNGVVQELSDFASHIMWDKEYVVRWIQRLSGVRTEDPVESSDLRSIQAVLKRRKALATIHSGNQYLKVKLKSFDDAEFALPSIAKRKGTNLTLAAEQSTDDETCSKSQIGADTTPHTKTDDEGDQGPKKEEEEQGKARRGVKRATQDSENKRQVKGRRISKEVNQNEEEGNTSLKPEVQEVTEGEQQETLVRTEGKRSDRNRKRSSVNSQMNEEKDEGPQTLGKTDPTKTPQQKFSTRRTSTMAVKEEKERQPEETKQGTDRSKRNRRPSVRLQEGKHDYNRPKTQKDKKKHESKEENDIEEASNEGEQKPVIKTQLETPARPRTSTRRGSTAQTRQEKTSAADETRLNKQTKSEANDKSKRGTDNKIEIEEDKQDHNHKDKEQNEVAKDQKKQSVSENLKSTKAQISGDERRIGTRRTSVLAEQEEKQGDKMDKEAGREKPSTRRGSKQEEEEVIKQVKKTDTDKPENRTDVKIGNETPRNSRSRRGSLIVQQEGTGRNRSRRISLAKIKHEKQEKEIENQITADAKEKLEETDKDDEPKQAVEKTGRDTKNRRSRKGSVIASKGKEKDKDDIEDKTEEVKGGTSQKEEPVSTNDAEQHKEKESKTKSNVEGEMDEEEDKPTSEHKKQDTEGNKENKLNESLDSDDNQVILKRNKVINRDKRISRWQNRKRRKDEEQTSPSKEEPDSECSQLEQTTIDDTQSDDSECNLMIDEGDSVLSDLSEDTHTGEGDSSVASEPSFTTPRKKKLNNEKEKQRKTNQRGGSVKKVKQESEKEVSEEELKANQDTGSKETSPHYTSTPTTTESSQRQHEIGSSYNGTLGISKSGRLRKPSAKGIQSIEIKCLFMQRDSEAPRPPPPLPVLKDDGKDKDWIQEKRSPVKYEKRERDLGQGRAMVEKYERRNRELGQEGRAVMRSESKNQETLSPKKLFCRTRKPGNEFTSYSYRDGHLVPTFKETDWYLGDYCAEAGVTVNDLNADGMKDVRMTFGMIKELHDFYTTRKATKTSLAIRLFKMKGQKILDNTHLLSTVIRLTSVASIRHTDTSRLKREFILPVRITYSPDCKEEGKSLVRIKQKATAMPSETSPKRVRKAPKKRGAKPEDSGDEEYYSYSDEAGEGDMICEVLLTCGGKGSITRGDIVHLYTKWLKDKMSRGSNTFVTDLMRSVEGLMAERCIAPIRIPAGTLMSSSVKLHDEYKQILRLSKEDAIMYLQEDWLEDIKYLLSISGPSRRSTTEAEGAPASTEESDTSAAEKQVKSEAVRHRSEGSEERMADLKVVPPKKTKPPKKYKERASLDTPRSHQMESVGKRKRRSVRKSLDEYERDILHELEKVGMLEEDEEDMLSQLDQDEINSNFVEEWEERDKQKKNDEKGNEKNSSKDIQKEIGSPRKGKRPAKEGDLDIEKIMDFQEIHDSRGKKHLRYLVRWAGQGSEEDSWLDESNMAPSLIDAFWKKKKKTRKSDRFKPVVRKDRSPKKADPSATVPAAREPRETEESIIQVMVKQGSAHQAANASEGSSIVTKRELLNLYDSWRQENQEELMAGGSNTVNVEVFKSRVRCLMAIRNVTFYPESLLHACFMMTLMKTRLQSKMAIDKFLDTSCLEVLESSHRQYLKRKHSQVEEVPNPSNKSTEEQNCKERCSSVLSLQNELHSLKLDLTSAQKWRAVKNSQLGAVEEEVDYLEAAMNMKKSDKATYMQLQLIKLKSDIKVLERFQKEGAEVKDPNIDEAPLFYGLASDQENYKWKSKLVRSRLTNMNISKATVNAIMDVVARRVSNQLV